MAITFRITVDDEYIKALGRAMYNYTYLEWIIIYTTARLTGKPAETLGLEFTNTVTPSGVYAKAFADAIDVPPSISPALASSLRSLHASYEKALREWQELSHAHPCTDVDGLQRLDDQQRTVWQADRVLQLAKDCEDAAVAGNKIYYGALAEERPTSK